MTELEEKINSILDKCFWSQHVKPHFDFERAIKELIELNASKEDELIEACKYGYEYHKTSSFPELEFEEMAINNFKQVLQSGYLTKEKDE